jgi:hypothetical protein
MGCVPGLDKSNAKDRIFVPKFHTICVAVLSLLKSGKHVNVLGFEQLLKYAGGMPSQYVTGVDEGDGVH